MTPTEAGHKIDRAITQAIGALRAVRRDGDAIDAIIADLTAARLSAMQLAHIASGSGHIEIKTKA